MMMAAAERTKSFVHGADALPTELTVAKMRHFEAKSMIRLAIIATLIRPSKYCIQMSQF